jgi:hypothetical protein
MEIPAFLTSSTDQVPNSDVDRDIVKVCRDIQYPYLVKYQAGLPEELYDDINLNKGAMELIEKVGRDIYGVFTNWDKGGYYGNIRMCSFPEGISCSAMLQSYISPEYDELVTEHECFIVEPVSHPVAFHDLTLSADACSYCPGIKTQQAQEYAWQTFATAAGMDWHLAPDPVEDALEGVYWYSINTDQSSLFTELALTNWLICINTRKNWLIDIRVDDGGD